MGIWERPFNFNALPAETRGNYNQRGQKLRQKPSFP